MAGPSRGSRRVGRGFYSIGLTERFDHPELVVAGVDLGHAHHVIDDMAAMVRQGARFDVGCSGVPVPHATVTIGAVHSVHLAGGLVNMWHAQYARRPDRPALDVVQVLLEPVRHQPRLDRPHTTFDVGRHVRFRRQGP